MAGAPKGLKRDGRYPFRLGVYLDESTGATLKRASERHGVSMGTIARCALQRGLQAELDSRRRKR